MSLPVESRARVLRAASQSFLHEGYRTSVDAIARRAGVAKQTVYHHFPSKDCLFTEVARELAKGVMVELEGGDLRAALTRFALAYRARALGAQGIAAFRALVPEVPRFRGLARTMYAESAGRLTRHLAAHLRAAMARGELRQDDAELAAEMFLGMLVGVDRVKRLFGMAPRGAEAERAARIVDCFLRAYSP